jgi:hypothetical protein
MHVRWTLDAALDVAYPKPPRSTPAIQRVLKAVGM